MTAPVTIDYTNWRGERRTRSIIPRCVRFGTTKYHPVPCWLLDARDYDTDESRTFRLADVHSWADDRPGHAGPAPFQRASR